MARAERRYVIADYERGLNFRSAPEVGDNVIRVIPYRKRLTVLEDVKPPYGWLAVRDGKQRGYVMAAFVREGG